MFNLGDVHGNWQCVLDFLYHNDYSRPVYSNTLINQVGDFNIGFDSLINIANRLTRINDMLVEHNNYLFIIRGNHDDPDWFNEANHRDIKDRCCSNIWFVPDYTIVNINLDNYLYVGGAISVDRGRRILDGLTHYKWEKFVLDEELVGSMRDIDRVITHNAPHFCPPTDAAKSDFIKDMVKVYGDWSLLHEVEQERLDITKMFEILKSNENPVMSWHHGHFHRSSKFSHNDCVFTCLAIDEFKEV